MKTIPEFLEAMKTFLADEPAPLTFTFAAGQEARLECGRSGTFVDMHKRKVTLKPAHFAEIVKGFDASGYHKLKVGHGPITSETPDYGDIVRVQYDEAADRLVAFAVPTEAAVEKNRKEGFKRCSMELDPGAGGDGFSLDHVSLLGAARPAISGLATIALAAPTKEEPYVEAVEEPVQEIKKPEDEIPLDKSITSIPEKKVEAAAPDPDKEKTKMSTERLLKQVKDGVRERVRAFMSANVTRIPMKLVQGGLEDGLVALLAAEADATVSEKEILFSIDAGKTQVSPSEFLFSVLALLPEQVTPEEKKEVALGGDEASQEDTLAFADADEKSVALHFAVEEEIKKAKAKGETINYLQATQRVERAQRSATK